MLGIGARRIEPGDLNDDIRLKNGIELQLPLANMQAQQCTTLDAQYARSVNI
jgi:hypothetical protein